MKIYGFPLSPFVRKTLVALAEKGVAFELVPTNPSQPDEEFSACSPFNKIPAMDDDGYRLADSTAIITYVDAQYSGPRLIPEDPKVRGRAIWFEEVGDTVLVPAGVGMVVNRFLRPKIFGTEGDEEAARASEEAVKKPLAYLEQAVSEGWLAGDFSVGDIAVASVIKTLGYAGWTLDPGAYPRLAAWYRRVSERPAWQASAEQERAIFAGAGLS
jgi:glutathione S-transferase